MPFVSKKQVENYHAEYRPEFRAGKRRVEPGDLATALIELRSLRAMVQKQRKRIWFLENKNSVTAKQRRRLRDVLAQDAAAALANLAKEPRKTK
jgi:hypothetical protein